MTPRNSSFDPTSTTSEHHELGGVRQPEWAKRWHEVKADLQNRYGSLTESDLRYEQGREGELYGRIGSRLGTTEREAEQLVQRSAGSRTPSEGERGDAGSHTPADDEEGGLTDDDMNASVEGDRVPDDPDEQPDTQASLNKRGF